MGVQESSGFCPQCQAQVLVRHETANHLLHAIVTLFLCGFWLPIWIIAALSPTSWRCTRCGLPTSAVAGSQVLALLGGLAMAMVLICGGVVAVSAWRAKGAAEKSPGKIKPAPKSP